MSSQGIWLSTPKCHVGALGAGLSRLPVDIKIQIAQAGVTGGSKGLQVKLDPQLAQNPRSANGDDL
jgi:hypothetical protein